MNQLKAEMRPVCRRRREGPVPSSLRWASIPLCDTSQPRSHNLHQKHTSPVRFRFLSINQTTRKYTHYIYMIAHKKYTKKLKSRTFVNREIILVSQFVTLTRGKIDLKTFAHRASKIGYSREPTLLELLFSQ